MSERFYCHYQICYSTTAPIQGHSPYIQTIFLSYHTCYLSQQKLYMPLTFKLIHHHHHLSNTLPSSSHPLHTTQYYLSPIYYPQNTAHEYIYSLNIIYYSQIYFHSSPSPTPLLFYNFVNPQIP